MNKIQDTLQNRTIFEREVKNHNSREYRFFMVRCFVKRIIATKGKMNIEEIELADIIQYIIYYKTTPITQKGNHLGRLPTRNAEYNYVCAIRTFFKYCCIVGMKLKFNREQIPLFRPDESKRDPMSEEDFELLHKAIAKYSKTKEIRMRDELMIEIPRDTGLRRSEIVRLKFEDFHNKNRQCRVLVKGNRIENVFYSTKLQKKVLEYEKLLNEKYKKIDFEYIFVCLGQKDKGKVMSSDLFGKKFRMMIRRMHEDGMLAKSKNLSLHQERHSFAMRCVYSGLSQQATTQLMRHKDPKITMHYYHMNDSRLLSQYDQIFN